MPVLFVLQTAFSLWMLSHAVKRNAPQMWWLIILIPFGEWVYFFTVYLPDRRGTRDWKALLRRPPTLAEIERDYRQTPSRDNLVRLASALHDAGRYSDASEKFSEALSDDPDDKQALFGYAVSARALGDREATIHALEHLVAADLPFREFGAAFLLAELYREGDEPEQAVALLRKACQSTQRLAPRVELARAMQRQERTTEARQVLEEGLDVYAGSPPFVRKSDRITAWKARQMLRGLPS